ncbi:Ca2+ Mg2+-permeable cation channel [Lecanosticta acicola]|uniref:Ca2+ Mg2+-permeable cation channel n=1 Tax=Lecanosticta acicola TaxID=111012 RepID=A0AAI8Z0I8_9PEZI|nr:Ca2+ Mg2+-permeable cation channel [Lecanosticta acicola]
MRAARSLPDLPDIDGTETFDALVRKLSVYFVQAIEAPHEWDELRGEVYGIFLRPLTRYLVDDVQHEAIVCALLALKWHFDALEHGDDRGINETRGLACELVAWRFVTHLTQRETIDFLCRDLPSPRRDPCPRESNGDLQAADLDGNLEEAVHERAPLLDAYSPNLEESFYDEQPQDSEYGEQSGFASTFANLNALEIAAVSNAKKFLGQKSIQQIIDGIWKGEIVFWETLGTHSKKEAKVYRKSHADPFCRLRVPLYLKAFEVLFFAAFLALYYVVLVQKHANSVTVPEIMLYVWLASFSYNELVEYWDAGSIFYATDFWSLWDLGIIFVGIAFFTTRMLGLVDHDGVATDVAFDILSIEALFLVPRICSLLSLHPYFGMLLPVLKEMTKDFIKFLGLVAILYLGFSTSFSFLARGTFTFREMNWILIKVFFGSSYLGFDIADQISPALGPPLMFIFVCMTNILLITSLISLLSNKLDSIMLHARDEYLFVYAVYVLEAATSNRLTFFLPPLNLLPLMLRPLRLIVSPQQLRNARIVLLKATHWPFVLALLGYERGRLWMDDRLPAGSSVGSERLSRNAPSALRRPLSRKAFSTTRPPLLGDQPRPGRSAAVAAADATPPASPETVEGLHAAVANLRTQVEQLSTMLSQARATAVEVGS